MVGLVKKIPIRASYLMKRKKKTLKLPFLPTRVKRENAPRSSEHLPLEDIINDLNDTEKICPHDSTALQHIGEETSEQLDIEPAKIKVLCHHRQKYTCQCCEQHMITATKPVQPYRQTQSWITQFS